MVGEYQAYTDIPTLGQGQGLSRGVDLGLAVTVDEGWWRAYSIATTRWFSLSEM